MKLISNWREILLGAWSMYGIYVTILLTILEAILYSLDRGMDPKLYLALVGAIQGLAGLGRLLDQRVADDDDDGGIQDAT
jgi:hypothetical protein